MSTDLGPRPGVSERIAALDGLRALAASAVAAYHLAPEWMPGGFLGVDVFLVLSGYLVTRELARGAPPGVRDIARLGWSRLARLAPLLLVTLLLVGALGPRLTQPWHMAVMREQMAAVLTARSNWLELERQWPPTGLTPLWYLALQLQLYALWPPLLAVVLRVPPRWRAVAGLSLTLAALAASFHASCACGLEDARRAYLGTDSRFLPFGVGAAAAWLARFSAPRPPAAAVRFARALSCGVLGVALMLASPVVPTVWCGGTLVFALAAVLVVAAAVEPSTYIPRILTLRPLVWLGRRSYGVYLLTLPALGLVTGLTALEGAAAAVPAACLCIVLAAATFATVEEPARRALMRLRERLLPRARA